MKPMLRYRSKMGFTAIEILVASMISVLVLSVGYRIWNRLVRTSSDISATSQYYQMASLAIGQMRMDFKSALSARRIGTDTLVLKLPSPTDWFRDIEVRYIASSGKALIRTVDGRITNNYTFSQFVQQSGDRLKFGFEKGVTP